MYFKLIFIRLFILLSGALFGYGILPSFWGISGSVLGMMAAMIAWTVIDIHRQQSIIHWIRSEDHSLPARASGHWADLADKLWRLWRQFDKQKTENDERLKQFLSAIQASPNGVVLLDQNNRIEWCNQTCAHHFDFDVVRDVDQNITNLLRDPVFIAYFQSGKYDTDIVINAPKSTSSHPVRISVHLHEYDRGRKLLLSRDITLLEQAESMRRDFVANVSHEIRTPLTVLGGFVDTLIHLPLEEAERLHLLPVAEQHDRDQRGQFPPELEVEPAETRRHRRRPRDADRHRVQDLHNHRNLDECGKCAGMAARWQRQPARWPTRCGLRFAARGRNTFVALDRLAE